MSYFVYHQNNSGGGFREPAVEVVVEAETLDEATEAASPYFTLCGDSGLYAEYDSCGCCPCCGHRWEPPWSDNPTAGSEIVARLRSPRNRDLHWLGGVRVALIRSDGSLLVGERRDEIEAYLEGGAS